VRATAKHDWGVGTKNAVGVRVAISNLGKETTNRKKQNIYKKILEGGQSPQTRAGIDDWYAKKRYV